MVDLLNVEIKVGDKIAFLPSKNWFSSYSMQYGIVEKLGKRNTGCWCKTLSSDNKSVFRYGDQIIKLN